MNTIIEDGDGDITSIKEHERLSRRYREEVLMPAVNSIADYLGLSIIVRDADYSNFEKALIDLISSDNK